ncbi:hypothetical protein CFE70_008904 [Pyrenophora teres f. teres 0-1]
MPLHLIDFDQKLSAAAVPLSARKAIVADALETRDPSQSAVRFASVSCRPALEACHSDYLLPSAQIGGTHLHTTSTQQATVPPEHHDAYILDSTNAL